MSYVLVVDDSRADRDTMLRCLRSVETLLTTRCAEDAFEARDMIANEDPELIVLSGDLPRMSGGEFLGLMMRHHPLPVVVMIDDEDPTGRMLEKYQLLGAIRSFSKPKSSEDELKLADNLTQIVKTLLQLKGQDTTVPCTDDSESLSSELQSETDYTGNSSLISQPIVIALGASTGGPMALSRIVRHFCANSPPVLIAQHISDRFLQTFVQGLSRETRMEVFIAKHEMPVMRGRIYVAPPEQHMEIDREGRVRLLSTVATDRFTPSVNVLFNSLARNRHFSVVAALLTGMGDDGAEGLLRLRQAGARTIAQDRTSCVVFGMPSRAIEIKAANEVLPIQEIGSRIVHHFKSLSGEANARQIRNKPEQVVTT